MNNYLIKTFFVFTLVLLNGLNCSFAQGYPNRPVRIISPIPPGSGTESAIRAIAQQMQIRTGQPWYIESKPGANYILAAEACAKAVPDGYTFCFFSGTVTSFNPYTFKKLPYDAERDFKPITRLFFLVNGLSINQRFTGLGDFKRGESEFWNTWAWIKPRYISAVA